MQAQKTPNVIRIIQLKITARSLMLARDAKIAKVFIFYFPLRRRKAKSILPFGQN